MKVLIKKLNTHNDAENPGGVSTDFESIKDVEKDRFYKPEVGKIFLLEGIFGYFHTSTIEEILEDNEVSGKFKTLNSIYYWEIIK